MWNDMPDIDGIVNGQNICNRNLNEEAWEVGSNTYTVSYDSNTDDMSSFINDSSTDYESSDDDDSEDEI